MSRIRSLCTDLFDRERARRGVFGETPSATTTSIGSGMCAPRALALGHDLARGVEQVVLAQRLADRQALRGEEGVGDAAADDQLVHLADQVAEQLELGRRPWSRRRSPAAGASARAAPWPAHRAQPSAAGRRRPPGETDHAVGRGLGAMRGAESVHDEDIAQRGVLARQRLVVLASPTFMRQFSSSTSSPGCDFDAVDPVAHAAAPRAQQLRTAAAATGASESSAVQRPPSAGPGARSPSPPRPCSSASSDGRQRGQDALLRA